MSYQPNILIIYSHTGYSGKLTNSVMLDSIKDLDFVTIHDLDALYGNNPIDVAFEQNALRKADVIIFNFLFIGTARHIHSNAGWMKY